MSLSQNGLTVCAELAQGEYFSMGKPKKRTSHRRTGTRRSHLVLNLARRVNAKSPVKALAKTAKAASNAQKKS